MSTADFMSEAKEALADLGQHGQLYHYDFYALIRDRKPGRVVETGSGLTTIAALRAMVMNDRGELYTIDPHLHPGSFRERNIPITEPNQDEHAHWHPLQMTSHEALTKIPVPWDIFLHDSDHGVYCQSLELEAAYHAVIGGGLIICDDSTWGHYPNISTPHGSWARFLQRHELSETRFGPGGAALTRKSTAASIVPLTTIRLAACDVIACQEADRYYGVNL